MAFPAYLARTALVLALFVGIGGFQPATTAFAQASNPIVAENKHPGSDGPWPQGQATDDEGPRSLSRGSGSSATAGLTPSDDAGGQIQGYASATSVNKGETITFYVTTNPAQPYTIDVYRAGWYDGKGRRLMQSIGPLQGIQQPGCLSEEYQQTGLIECKWSPSYTLSVPATWTSGVYLAQLKNQQGYTSYIIFVVRDDSRKAELLVALTVTTYQAYNNYPNDGKTGKSLYTSRSYGPSTVVGNPRAVKVSFDRPFSGLGGGYFWNKEYVFIKWMERLGYDVSYVTNIDVHANGAMLRNYKGFLSVGHDEYWSTEMYNAAESARDSGVNLAFFGANDVYWQVRFEPSSSGVPNRVMVCYKYASGGDPATGSVDPVVGPTTTVKWRDPIVGRPEQTLLGIQFPIPGGIPSGGNPYIVRNSGSWLYTGTGFSDGDSVAGLVVGEVDRYMPEYPAPRNTSYTLLSQSPFTEGSTGSTYYSNSSLYRAPSGAWVFAAGTLGWAKGLPGGQAPDARIGRTTANLLYRFVDHTAPVVSAPKQWFVLGSALGNWEAPVRLTWSGTDDRSGIALYRLQQSTDGGPFVDVPLPLSTATSATLALKPLHAYQFRVGAYDGGVNWSGWRGGPVFRLARYQEESPEVLYLGRWNKVSLKGTYGGYVKYSTQAGATASISFTGRNVAWVAGKNTNRGKARIYVDGVYARTVDLYSPSLMLRRVVYTRSWASSSTHTLTVKVVGTSGRPRIDVDAFLVAK